MRRGGTACYVGAARSETRPGRPCYGGRAVMGGVDFGMAAERETDLPPFL